jgi:hypothetical protein
MNLSIVNGREAAFREIAFLHPVAANECAKLAQCPERHPGVTHFVNQIVDPAH